MRIPHARMALSLALILAGCATQPTATAPAGPSSDPLGLGDAVAARYQTLSANAAPLAIATVSASSTATEIAGFTASASSVRDGQWFSVSNLTDGNLHSAWGPAGNDPNPTLTLNLAQSASLTGLGIKMDDGATFDVAVNNGGTWTTVATNVTPQYRALDFISLKTQVASQVKLTFHVQPNAQLLVCEVKLFTGGCGAPSTAPSTVPSVTPSATPSVTPSTMPSTPVCESLSMSGDIFTNQSFPVFGIQIQASGGASGAFGLVDLEIPTAADSWRGLVNAIQFNGDTLTVSGLVNLFADVGPGPSMPFTVTAKITSRTNTTFTAVVTGATISGQDMLFGAAITKGITINGTFGDCVPAPTGCFTLSGDGLYFPIAGETAGSPTYELKLTNLVHSGSRTTGSIALTDFNTTQTVTGQVTEANFDNASGTVSFSGTLMGGGTFKLVTTIGDAEPPNTFRTTLTGITLFDASGNVLVNTSTAVAINNAPSFSGTFGCL